MLVLKIMHDEDLADDDSRKHFTLVSNVSSVRFVQDPVTEYERTFFKNPKPEEFSAQFAVCEMVGGGTHRYIVTGNCYVMNDRGRTIETFWGREREVGAGRDPQEQRMHTLYNHGFHNADGSLNVGEEHCCGCWDIVQDRDGIRLECNECGEKREFPENMAFLQG